MQNGEDVIAALKQLVDEVDLDEGAQLVADGAVYVDVREEDETARGIIPGAICIPLSGLEDHIATLDIAKDKELVVYCATGRRSLYAARMLDDAGYSKTHSLHPGIVGWMRDGREVVAPQ